MADVLVSYPNGQQALVPEASLPQALSEGATVGAPAASAPDDGGVLGAVGAGLLGAGSAATLGATDRLFREGSYVLGGRPFEREVTSNLQAVRERNPGATLAGEFGGLLLNPEVIAGVGEGASGALAGRLGGGLVESAATSAARLAAESAVLEGQHQLTEQALGDHEYNGEAIFANAAKGALLGAPLGAGFGALGYGARGLLGSLAGDGLGLVRRSGPISHATLDEIAGVEGAGAGLRDRAAQTEGAIQGLRATGATTDQAVGAVQGIEEAARARTIASEIERRPVDFLSQDVLDAGLSGAQSAERPFAIGSEEYNVRLRPDARPRIDLESPLSLTAPPTPAAEPLDAFADVVRRVGDETKGRFGRYKVFISNLSDRVRAEFPGMSEAEFRSKLIEAHREGKLTLARADLAPAMNKEVVAASETPFMNGTFHFVDLEGGSGAARRAAPKPLGRISIDADAGLTGTSDVSSPFRIKPQGRRVDFAPGEAGLLPSEDVSLFRQGARASTQNDGVAAFAERIASGAKLDSPADIQFYQNNAKAIEAELSAMAGAPRPTTAGGLIDSAIDEYAAKHGGERATQMRQLYREQTGQLAEAAARQERNALELRRAGTSVMRNIEDVSNDMQFAQKADRFARFVDPAKLDAQADLMASLIDETDTALAQWDAQYFKGGKEGAIRDIRNRLMDLKGRLSGLEGRDPSKLGSELFIEANKLKQALDSKVNWNLPGSIVDGKRVVYGGAEAEGTFRNLADRWRGALESDTWGEAGARQARENFSFSDMKARKDDLLSKLGVATDRSQGVVIPEFDYAKSRSFLDSLTGSVEADEALQPTISARRAIDGWRQRATEMLDGATPAEAAKLRKGLAELDSFERTLNEAMKDAGAINRMKSAIAEEKANGLGGLIGLVGDTITRPLKTIERLAQMRNTVHSVENGAKKAVRALFEGGAESNAGAGIKVAEKAPRPKAQVVEEMQNIRELASNPPALEQAAMRLVGDLSRFAPQTANEVRLAAIRALMYLAKEAPPATTTNTGAFGKVTPRYSDIQIHDWETKRDAAFDPRSVLDDMKHGRLNRDAIQAAEVVSPKLFAMLQQTAWDELQRMDQRGELDRMPYQRKAAIATLLKIPVDKTWEPDFIRLMQGALAQSAPPPQPPQQRQPTAPAKPPAWLVTQAQQIEGGM